MEQPKKATPLDEPEQNSIAAAIARIPSGCSILTTGNESRATGTLVSWVQQAAFDPPVITVSLKRGRAVQELIDAGGRFTLNVIGEDRSKMFQHFAKGFSLEEDAFAGLRTEPTPYGPRLSDAIAHLGCRVMEKVAAGDHDLYVAQVVAGIAIEGKRPYVHIRNSGLSY